MEKRKDEGLVRERACVFIMCVMQCITGALPFCLLMNRHIHTLWAGAKIKKSDV